MHKKKIYYRLTGVACFLIGVLAIIFSLFLMPIGGSRAQTSTTATFLPGETVNLTIKSLATGATLPFIYRDDSLIQQIVRTGNLAQGFTTGLLSTSDSEVPIIAWFDSGILYYYTEADVIYLNQNSDSMFYSIKSCTYIDTSAWDTSKVTIMSNMFNGCSSLTGLDVSSFDTSKVTNMGAMFKSCNNLTSLDISQFDTSKVTNMGSMFAYSSSLTSLDVSNFNTSEVIYMNEMFENCSNLVELDISNFDTSNVTYMDEMFHNCSSLKTIYASTGFITSGIIYAPYVFSNTPKLIGGHGTKFPSLGATKSGAVLDSEIQSGYLTYDIAVSYRTRSGVELARQVINVGDTTVAPSITGYNVLGYYSNTGLSSTFDFSHELRTYTEVYVDYECATGYKLEDGLCKKILTATFLTGNYFNSEVKCLSKGLTTNCGNENTLIEKIVRTGNLVDGFATGLLSTNNSEVPIIGWFDNGILYYYTEAEILYLNQDSSNMFDYLKSVTYIDTSGWNINKVTNMRRMFYMCNSLISLDVSNWDTSNVTTMEMMFTYCESLTGLDVSNWNTSNLVNMGNLFEACYALTDLDVSNWDTSNVTSMWTVFNGCESLTELDVSNWDTSKVTNMGGMFGACESLTELDVSHFDTSNVTYIADMFSDCINLTELDVSNFDTSNVVYMHRMFYWCSSLTGLDLTNFDTSNVKTMESMFEGGLNLTSLDVSSWDTSNVTNMKQMFYNCDSLRELDLHNFDTSSVINMNRMFFDSNNLETIYASTGFVTSGVTDSSYMFSNTPKLLGGHGTKSPSLGTTKSGAVLDSESQSGYLTYDIAVSYRTRSGVELARQVINVGDTTVAPSITGYNVMGYYTNTQLTTPFDFNQELRKYTEVYVDWDGCETGYLLKNGLCVAPVTATFLPGQTVNTGIKSLATGARVISYTNPDTLIQQIVRTGSLAQGFTTGLLSTTTSEVPIIAWYDNGTIYYYTEADIIYLNQNSTSMFFSIQSGTYIDTSGWDTSKVTNMGSMFFNCNTLTELNVSDWNTSKVTNMSDMFRDCRGLMSLDVSRWDTSSVTYMGAMFFNCRNLTELNVSDWNTSKVTKMGNMFTQCSSLTELDVSNWDTSNVTTMYQMFYSCSGLTSLDVSSWDTSSVTTMTRMFNNCRNLTELDVSNWVTSGVTDMYSMFGNCSSLTGLDVSNWNTSTVTNMSYMFAGCSSLTELDVSNWVTSGVTDMSYMFKGCNKLNIIYASTGFITSGVTNSSDMFISANKLVGGHGTKYSSSYKDKTRAVLDSESESGYFTYDIAVSYRTRSGVELARQVINVGDTTVAPSITGYNVLGYYSDTGLTTPFNFSQELRKYTEVYVDLQVFESRFEKNGADSIGAHILTGGTIIMPSITRSGYLVLGWSTNSGATEAEYQTGETVVISGDTTFYAITKKTYIVTFQKNGATSIGATGASCSVYNTQTSCGLGVGDITICNPVNAGECLTVQDRNLGAGAAGTGLCSYGNYYQWGNNYGFPGDGGSISLSREKVDCSPYGVGNYYSGSTFIRGDTIWCTTFGGNENLWGGSGDYSSNNYGYPMTNPTDRQGPCSEGYHIPSIGEWNKALEWWASGYILEGNALILNNNHMNLSYFSNDSGAALAFINYFIIPFAGYRSDYAAEFRDLGASANLSSSSETAHYIKLNSSKVNATQCIINTVAQPIRCFKNEPLTQPNKGQVSSVLAPSIIRDGYEILGWSTNPDTTDPEYHVCDEISLSGDEILYAITSKLATATFKPNGNELDGGSSDIIKSCIVYNNATGCQITTPTITNSITTTVVGYTTTSTGSSIASIGSNTGLWIYGKKTYYAQTMSGVSTVYRAQFTGVLGVEDLSCDTAVYNGDMRTPSESCQIIAPNIELKYSTVSGVDVLTICGQLNIDPSAGGYSGLDNDEACITIMDRNLGASSAGIGCNFDDFYCKYGYFNGGRSDYESCYNDCRGGWGESEEYCVDYCTVDLKGYDNGSDCESAMEIAHNECLEINSGVYGKYYQWGNNYGFSRYETVDLGTQQIDCTSYNPLAPFSGSTFIKTYGDYCIEGNNNMWGGGNDNYDNNYGYPVYNPMDRQGPCPDGYHVPSQGEWGALLNLWSHKYTGTVDYYYSENGSTWSASYGGGGLGKQFQRDFKIPFAGNNYGDEYYQFDDFAYLWSSTPYTESSYARDFEMENGYIYTDRSYYRSFAESVRCFKNVPEEDTKFLGWTSKSGSIIVEYEPLDVIDLTGDIIFYAVMPKVAIVTYDANGGGFSIGTGIETHLDVLYGYNESTMEYEQLSTYTDPVRSGYIFDGWYTDTGYTIPFENSGIENNLVVYAKWECSVGYIYNGNECEPRDDTLYMVRHYLKDAGLLTYSLYDTEEFSGTTNDQIWLSGYAKNDIPCAYYMSGSLTGTTSGPGPVAQSTTIAPDGSTVLYLYYNRRSYTVDLDKDNFTSIVEGAGTYECGQEVQIRAYPIEGYHFDEWDGEVN